MTTEGEPVKGAEAQLGEGSLMIAVFEAVQDDYLADVYYLQGANGFMAEIVPDTETNPEDDYWGHIEVVQSDSQDLVGTWMMFCSDEGELRFVRTLPTEVSDRAAWEAMTVTERLYESIRQFSDAEKDPANRMTDQQAALLAREMRGCVVVPLRIGSGIHTG